MSVKSDLLSRPGQVELSVPGKRCRTEPPRGFFVGHPAEVLAVNRQGVGGAMTIFPTE
jgi:hypothetical protein